MALQRLAALVQGDGILKLHLALLQPGDDGFQLAQRRLETEAGDVGGWGWRGDGSAPDAGGTPPPILIPPVAGGKVYGLPIAQFQVRCIIKVTCRQRY